MPGDAEPSDDSYADENEQPAQLPQDAAFDLFYFDQMAERDDAVRLTLRRAANCKRDGADAAPLESVILTRWPNAVIDWNGEEVVL